MKIIMEKLIDALRRRLFLVAYTLRNPRKAKIVQLFEKTKKR
jgi:hypothetical protein